MSKINKLRLSGTSYDIEDKNAAKTVELTQAQYDALSVKDPNTFYIITDAQGGDLSNYYTKDETDDLLDEKLDVTAYTPTDLTNYYTKSETSGATQISTALNGKQETLVSGTNIKTINNTSLLGSGNIDIQGGGSVTVDTELDSGSTNPVQNKVIYAKFDEVEQVTAAALNELNDALSGKQDTLIAGDNITISGNVISASGGGATYSAGTNISIANDTINCTIPAYFNSNEQKGDIAIGTRINNTHSDYYKVIIGRQIDAYGNSNSSYSVGIAPATNNSSFYSQLKGNNAVGIGKYFKITGHGSVAIGSEAESSVENGVAIGHNTVASGTTKTNLNNQIKVDTSNQVYIYNKDNTEMICLQDNLGGGEVSSAITSGDTNAVAGGAVYNKFDEVEQVTAAALNALNDDIDDINDAMGGLKLVKLTQAQYDALVTKDNSTLYVIVN